MAYELIDKIPTFSTSSASVVGTDGTYTVSASSYYTSTDTCQRAFVKTTSYRWRANTMVNAWIQIKCPVQRRVTHVEYSLYTVGQDIKDCILYGSNDDGVTLETLWEGTVPGGNELYSVIPICNGDWSYSIYRLYIKSSYSPTNRIIVCNLKFLEHPTPLTTLSPNFIKQHTLPKIINNATQPIYLMDDNTLAMTSKNGTVVRINNQLNRVLWEGNSSSADIIIPDIDEHNGFVIHASIIDSEKSITQTLQLLIIKGDFDTIHSFYFPSPTLTTYAIMTFTISETGTLSILSNIYTENFSAVNITKIEFIF